MGEVLAESGLAVSGAVDAAIPFVVTKTPKGFEGQSAEGVGQPDNPTVLLTYVEGETSQRLSVQRVVAGGPMPPEGQPDNRQNFGPRISLTASIEGLPAEQVPGVAAIMTGMALWMGGLATPERV